VPFKLFYNVYEIYHTDKPIFSVVLDVTLYKAGQIHSLVIKFYKVLLDFGRFWLVGRLTSVLR